MTFDWDHLRFFLAVAEQGSTKRGAAFLKVDQTTCSRRIASLEAALGLSLFDRRPSGFALTEAGERLVPAARDMSQAATTIATVAAQLGRGREAVIRLSVGDLLVEPVVRPALAEMHRSWPNVLVDLSVESRYVDITGGEADIAIRPGDRPTDPDIVVRRLGDNPLGVYCTQAYADRHGMPTTPAEHLDRPFACMAGRAFDTIKAHFPDKRPRFIATSLQPLVDAVASGDVAAMLPSLHVASRPDFLRCFGIEADTGSIWLLYHPRLRADPAVRGLARAIGTSFRRWANAS